MSKTRDIQNSWAKCNIYIPIGGVGSRLRKGLKTFSLPSKCFIEYNNSTLLESIVARTAFVARKYHIIYCHKEQYDMSYKLLGDFYQGIPIVYVHNSSSNPYACLPVDEGCLAVMGDTFAPEDTFKTIVSVAEQEGKIVVLKLEPEIRSQPNCYYLLHNSHLIDYSKEKKDEYKIFDIGQVLYFPKSLIVECLEKAITIDPLSMLHYYIKTTGIMCLDLNCININTVEDFQRVFK
ncbi:MAG: hypothetical protein IKT41_00240 [Clostridia bacterium]|nr:hypothetical protein [Clostridia bacterium]